MKKILIIMPDLIPGGAERIVINIANSIDRSQFICEFVLLNYSSHHFASQLSENVKIYDLKIKRFRHIIFKPYKFIKVLLKSKPDIIFSAYGELNSFVIVFKLFFGKFIFVARETSIPSLRYSNHLMILLNKLLYKFFDKIIVQSNSMLIDLVDNFNIEKDKLVKINNMVDTNSIDQLINNVQINRRVNGVLTFLYVGSLSKHKGIISIIEYFNLLRDNGKMVHLILIGSGPYLSEIERKISISPYKLHIDLRSWVINPYEYMCQADFLIIGSDYEGFPNVGLEANYCGLPVLVSTRTLGGAKELIINNFNGQIVQFEESNFSYLEKEFNSNLIKDYIFDNYSIEKVIVCYERLFNDLLI